MTPIERHVAFSTACMRFVGHALAAQMQAATILTRSVLKAPFLHVRQIHDLASRPAKPVRASKPVTPRKTKLGDAGLMTVPAPAKAPKPVARVAVAAEIAPEPAINPAPPAKPKAKAKTRVAAAPKAPAAAAKPAAEPSASPKVQPAPKAAEAVSRKPRAPSMPPAMPERVTKH